MPRGAGDRSLTVRATLALRELVLEGELAPGQRVAELALVERLGASRTPLRIALQTLEHEGLLEALPGGGFVVRGFTRAEVDDAIELRGVLEGTAARLAAERLGSVAELAPLHEQVRRMDTAVEDEGVESFVEYVAANEAFHARLLALAKSSVLARQHDRVCSLPFAGPSAFLSVQARLPGSREILRVAQHQHRAIVEAIAAREGTRAEAVAREHSRLARANLELVLEHRDVLAALPGGALLEAS